MKKFLLFCISMSVLSGAYGSSVSRAAATIPGDTNDNGIVSIADIVTLVNHILEIPTTTINMSNMDINRDGVVTVSDITSTVDIIFHKENPEFSEGESRSVTKIADRLISDNFKTDKGETGISVLLDNSIIYSSLQAELTLPEGMTVTDIVPGPRAANHQLIYNETERGTIKVILFTFSNIEFLPGTEPLFTINATVWDECGNLTLNNIIAANSDSYNYELGFAGGLNETGIGRDDALQHGEVSISPVRDGVEVRNATGQTITVSAISGELIKTVVAVSEYEKIRLNGGIYVITVGNLSKKVIVQ